MPNGEDPDDYGGAFMHPEQEERDETPSTVAKLTFFSQLFNMFNFAKKKRVVKKVKDRVRFLKSKGYCTLECIKPQQKNRIITSFSNLMFQRKPSSTAPVIQERLVMRDHEVRLRCLLTASQSALLVANPVGVRDDEWFDDEAEFDLFDYSVEEADDGLAKGLAIIMNGVFSHRPIRSARRYAAYYGVRRNGEKWNPRFYGFDY